MEATKNKETKQPENSKSLNGEEKTSAWEKAAEMIAGDNQLMSSLLKLLLSPFTLLAGAGLIIYLFITNNNLKREMQKLKEEITKLSDEKNFLIGEAESFREKCKKLKKVLEIEKSHTDQQRLLRGANTVAAHTNKNKSNYLI